SLASQPHRRDAIPQDLELDVQAKFATELGVDPQRRPLFSAGTHADHREHRPDDMMLGPVQVLFEGAASDAKRKADLFRRRFSRELVVAGLVRGEESPRLLLGELRQEERGRIGDPISARRSREALRNKAGPGELIYQGLRVGPVLADPRAEIYATLRANRR